MMHTFIFIRHKSITIILMWTYISLAEPSGFGCPTSIFYSDVKGLTMVCEPFPSVDSKMQYCFKDLWWKYTVYGSFDIAPVDDPNFLDVLDLPECRKTCKCTLAIIMNSLDCINHGRPPQWSNDFSLQQRNAFKCKGLDVPFGIENEDHVSLACRLVLLNAQSNGKQALLEDLLSALDKLGVESLEINTMSPAITIPLTSLVDFFAPNKFSRLRSLTFSSDASLQVPWSSSDKIIQNITSSVYFFSVFDYNFTAIPKPAFIDNVRALTCHRCGGLRIAPEWLKEAPNLLFLHLSAVSSAFPLQDLPPSVSLLHFSFTNAQIPALPVDFNLSGLYPNLENLDLSNLNLSVVPNAALRTFKHLRRLDLSGNCLTPLPALDGLKDLTLLMLDGFTTVYGVDFEHTPLYPFCQYGSCKAFNLTRNNLRDLINLKFLSVSFYQDLQIDDDAFADLKNLNRFSMNCVNLKSFPIALRSTCGLKWLSAKKDAFNVINVTDPLSYPIPLFIPKYFIKLRELTLDDSNMKVMPPSMLTFKTAVESRLLQTISTSVLGNALLAANACEIFKFERAYKLLYSVIPNYNLNSTQQCLKEYDATIKLVRAEMEKVQDFCIRTTDGGTQSRPTAIVVLVCFGALWLLVD